MTADDVGVVVGIVGCGVTGGQVATQLCNARVDGRRIGLIVHDENAAVAGRLASFVGGLATDRVEDLAAADVVAFCQPTRHAALVERFLDAGVAVVSTSDDPDDVIDLLGLASEAMPPLVIGAAMAPGLANSSRGRPIGTRSTSRSVARAAPRAPAATTAPSAPGHSGGRTASGSNGRAAAAASCAGSPIRWGPVTATGRHTPIPCSCTSPSPRSSGSRPRSRPPAGTG